MGVAELRGQSVSGPAELVAQRAPAMAARVTRETADAVEQRRGLGTRMRRGC